LDDAAWATAVPVGGFVQRFPREGAAATGATEVRVLYDDAALWVGARMRSARPGDVQAPVGRRDNVREMEHLAVSLDTYHDRRTAYTFVVTASGVRGDWYHPRDDERAQEPSFDPVWQAAAHVDADGWTAELRIPFSQLRFTGTGAQTWGVNFQRWVASRNEDDLWAPVPQNVRAWASRFGTLDGVDGVRPTQRVELLPYAAQASRVNAVRHPANPFDDGRNLATRAGGDLKVGLGPNLTLDATVNPDFGQVEADPAVVNLSAFEINFPERRPFFVEGAPLLRGGGNNYFYSRRIGAGPLLRPAGDFTDVPQTAAILGAAKLTGRLPSGLSVGVLAALTDRVRAAAFDTARAVAPAASNSTGVTGPADDLTTAARRTRLDVAPRSAYVVARLQQEFGRDRSTAGVLLTGVRRDVAPGTPLGALYARDAATAAADWNLRFRRATYEFSGSVSASRVGGDSAGLLRVQRSSARFFQRPDAGYVRVDPSRTALGGASGTLTLERISGRHWLWRGDLGVRSPGFEINDLGFLPLSDRKFFVSRLTYRETRPTRYLQQYSVGFVNQNVWNFGNELLSQWIRPEASLVWRNLFETTVSGELEASTLNAHLTRGGPYMGVYGGRGGGVEVASPRGATRRVTLGAARYTNAAGCAPCRSARAARSGQTRSGSSRSPRPSSGGWTRGSTSRASPPARQPPRSTTGTCSPRSTTASCAPRCVSTTRSSPTSRSRPSSSRSPRAGATRASGSSAPRAAATSRTTRATAWCAAACASSRRPRATRCACPPGSRARTSRRARSAATWCCGGSGARAAPCSRSGSRTATATRPRATPRRAPSAPRTSAARSAGRATTCSRSRRATGSPRPGGAEPPTGRRGFAAPHLRPPPTTAMRCLRSIAAALVAPLALAACAMPVLAAAAQAPVAALAPGTSAAAPRAVQPPPWPTALSEPTSAALLARLPDGPEKRKFLLDCTGCHQFSPRVAYPGGRARTAAEWEDAVTRMLRYGGARGPFPVIHSDRDPAATAAWLARYLPTAAPARAPNGPGEAPARLVPPAGTWAVTEYALPAPWDLPHDVAVAADGRVVVTGMMTDRMYVLDPGAPGARARRFDAVPIPVPRANPRAVEIDPAGRWWVALGAPGAVAVYDPARAAGDGAWRTFAVGVYPHSVALGAGDGEAWFNGHFTRAPALIGRVRLSPLGAAGRGVDSVALAPHPTLAADPGGPIPYEIRVAPGGVVWTSELHGNRLVAYDPRTRRTWAVDMPESHSGPRRFDVDPSGVLWVPAYATNALSATTRVAARDVGVSPASRCRSMTPRPMWRAWTVPPGTCGSAPRPRMQCCATRRARAPGPPSRCRAAGRWSGTWRSTRARATCG
jgi:streptogramin lyase